MVSLNFQEIFNWVKAKKTKKNQTNAEHKLHKTKIENWLSIGFEVESLWLGTYSHNHYTRFNLQYDDVES